MRTDDGAEEVPAAAPAACRHSTLTSPTHKSVRPQSSADGSHADAGHRVAAETMDECVEHAGANEDIMEAIQAASKAVMRRVQDLRSRTATNGEQADMMRKWHSLMKIGKHSVRKKSLRQKWPRNRTCLAEMNATSMRPWATPSSDAGARRVSMVRARRSTP